MVTRFYFTILLITLFSCAENPELDSSATTKEISTETIPDSQLDWRNPALFPVGASIGNYLRAYYMVGEFHKMLPFLIIPDCMDREEVIYKLRRMNWGYDIKMTNVQWQVILSTVVKMFRGHV